MDDGPDIRRRLARPDVRLREAWLAAYAEWPAGSHQDGSGLRETTIGPKRRYWIAL
jgi:hypothetical protein